MILLRNFTALLVSALLLCDSAFGQESPDFQRDIAPIISARCLECHSDQEKAGGLALTSSAALKKGGESGEAIDASDLSASLLLFYVSEGQMPPPRQGKPQKLPDAEIELLRRWVLAGAPWPEDRILDPFEATTATRAGRDWWSLQPIKRVTPPANEQGAPSMNPIDAFVRDRLAKEGFTPAPRADARTLIRRLYFDVTGLPPSPEEVEAFVKDPSQAAYARLVDRLLSSPQFGERFARHWLDLVRYADTSGYERDQEKTGAWRYRDYVVTAFNEDLPYNRFILEQLAGDELDDRSERSVIATGFMRLGTWNDEPNDPEEYKYERLEDLVHATGTAFLGLTIKCARCHDHKFDPISHTDYHRLASIFWSGPIEPGPRELLGGPSKEQLGYDVLGWTDVAAEAKPFHRLKKGDPNRPEEEVAPATLSFLPALERELAPPPPGAKTTHRRRQMAEWIIDPQNPLTPRVITNWVWTHYFRRGLVNSPGNFGFTGAKPSHPELLDYLASELMENGWRLKHLHRLILLSETYQQSSSHPQEEAYAERDSGVELLWRAVRKRLDAESIRDAMLAAGGDIDLRVGGPGFRPPVAPEALEGLSRKSDAWQVSPQQEQTRRSLYLYAQRSLQVPLMATFDASDTSQPCPQREVTTVAPQALAMMNNAFTLERCDVIASKLISSDDPIGSLYRQLLQRAPTPRERELCSEFLAEREKQAAPTDGDVAPQKEQAFAALCHVLLSSNEFIFID